MKLRVGLGFNNKTASASAIAGLTNVISDVDFSNESAYTFSSGVEITSCAAVTGIGSTALGDPVYDSTMFGGVGGFKTVLQSEIMRHTSVFSATAVQTIFFVIQPTAHVSTKSYFVFAAGDANGSQLARLTHSAPGDFQYRNNEAGGTSSIQNGTADVAQVICMRYDGTSSLDFFLDGTATTVNIDPDDTYSTLTKIRLGNRQGSDGDAGVGYGRFIQTPNAETTDTILAVMQELGTQFGITIT